MKTIVLKSNYSLLVMPKVINKPINIICKLIYDICYFHNNIKLLDKFITKNKQNITCIKLELDSYKNRRNAYRDSSDIILDLIKKHNITYISIDSSIIHNSDFKKIIVKHMRITSYYSDWLYFNNIYIMYDIINQSEYVEISLKNPIVKINHNEENVDIINKILSSKSLKQLTLHRFKFIKKSYLDKMYLMLSGKYDIYKFKNNLIIRPKLICGLLDNINYDINFFYK